MCGERATFIGPFVVAALNYISVQIEKGMKTVYVLGGGVAKGTSVLPSVYISTFKV